MGQTIFFCYLFSRMPYLNIGKTISKDTLYARPIRRIWIITFLLWGNYSSSQNYYATNRIGEMELINDSMYTISFYANNDIVYYDTGYYYCEDDKIIMTSRTSSWAEILEEFDTTMCHLTNEHLYVIRRYHKEFGRYQLWGERIINSVYQTGSYDIFSLGRNTWYPNDIIVVYDNNSVWRRCRIGKSVTYGELFIKLLPSRKEPAGRLYFDHFCLRKKGNRLIPMTNSQQFECWVVNGFIFPTMQRKKKTVYKTFVGHRGLLGIEIDPWWLKSKRRKCNRKTTSSLPY